MADLDRLKRALVEADKAGDTAAASSLARAIRQEMQGQPTAPADTRSFGSRAFEAVDDTVRSLASGMTFGLADEAAAGLSTLTGVGGQGGAGADYERNLAAERARDAAIPAGQRIPAEIAGGVATTVAAAPLGLARLVASGMPGAAAVGAGEGALAGFGYSEGGLEERAKGAGMGLAVGGVAGAALPAAVQGVRNMAAKRAPVPAAVRKVNRYLSRDKLTPQQAAQIADDMGEGATLADAGRNLTSGAEVMASRPGTAMDLIEGTLQKRADTQAGRILAALDNAAGPPGQAVARTIEGGAWDAVLDKTIPLTGDLKTLLTRPTMRAAYRAAQRLAAEKGDELPPLERVMADDMVGVQTRVMHWLKKGLDDVLEPKRDAVTGMVQQQFGANQLRAANETRRTFREAVKALNPDYGDLLQTEAGNRRIDEAFRLGSEFFKRRNDREVTAQMRRLTDEQRRAYQRGVIQAIEDKINPRAEVGYDVSGQVLRQGDKLRAVFGDKADDVMKTLQSERKFMLNKNQITGNSRTAFRQAAQADDAGSVVADIAVDAATGAPTNLLPRIGRAVLNHIRRPNEATAVEVGKLLMAQTPEARQQAVAALTKQYGARRMNDVLAAALSSAGGRTAGQGASVQPMTIEFGAYPGREFAVPR